MGSEACRPDARDRRRVRAGVLGATATGAFLLLAACASAPRGAASASAERPENGCVQDLLVQFSPSVQTPTSQRFVSSLLPGSGYALRYVRSLGATQLVRLTGPGSSCDEGVDELRRDPRVHTVELDQRKLIH